MCIFVVRKELEQTLPKTACPGHAVVGKVCLVTSPKTVFVCISSSFARSLGWPCPRQHALGMLSWVRCSEIPNLVCSYEGNWFLASSVSDVYGSSTHCGTRKRVPLSSPGHPATKFYNTMIALSVVLGDCCKPMKGCQLFSCLCTPKVKHCRKEICSTCLSRNPCLLLKSKPPLPSRRLRSLRSAARSTSSLWLHYSCKVMVSKLWITGYWLWSRLSYRCDCWKSMKNCPGSDFKCF